MKPMLFSLFVLVFSPVLSGCLSPAEWEVARICGTQPNDPSCQTARDRAAKERESEREWSEGVREDQRIQEGMNHARGVSSVSDAWSSTIREANRNATQKAILDPQLASLNGGWCVGQKEQRAATAQVINILGKGRMEMKVLDRIFFEVKTVRYSLRASGDGWYQLVADWKLALQPEGVYDKIYINAPESYTYVDYEIYGREGGRSTTYFRCSASMESQ